ncbi:MAG: hypothetical protein Q8S54_19840 [Bacteroidota bacterium]|nr:hypothetical protein [Bacteroidota bacterium]
MEKNKQISVVIDGVTYTPVYNMNTMSKFSDRHGLTVEDFTRLSHMSLRHILDLVFLGCEEYCRIKKIECPFDVYRIGQLDTDTLSLLIESISVNMMKLPKVEGN